MSRESTLEKIKVAIKNGCLTEPFNVSNIKKCIPEFKSNAFISKHAHSNPGDYKEYFIRTNRGRYKLKK